MECVQNLADYSRSGPRACRLQLQCLHYSGAGTLDWYGNPLYPVRSPAPELPSTRATPLFPQSFAPLPSSAPHLLQRVLDAPPQSSFRILEDPQPILSFPKLSRTCTPRPPHNPQHPKHPNCARHHPPPLILLSHSLVPTSAGSHGLWPSSFLSRPQWLCNWWPVCFSCSRRLLCAF